jgi:hypothetical protein
MNILSFGSRFIHRMSPVGLVAGTVALALVVPPVRRGLRSIAVTAAGGVLSVTDEAKKLIGQSREGVQDIVSEAKSGDCCPSCDFSAEAETVRSAPRKLAVAATMGVLAARDKAKSVIDNASEQIESIVNEAKSGKNADQKYEDQEKPVADGLEPGPDEIHTH